MKSAHTTLHQINCDGALKDQVFARWVGAILRSLSMGLVVLSTSLISASVYAYNATGNEDRCESLGANCVCSEPLNTNNLVQSGQYSLDPADTSAKECRNADGEVIAGNNGGATPTNFIVADNASSVLAALPPGNAVNYFVRGPQDNNGGSFAIFYLGHVADSTYTKRMAWRYYVYHTPNFEFAYTNDCSNSKWAQGPVTASIVNNGTNNVSINYYALWNNWTYNNGTQTVGDCCQLGPPYRDSIQPASFYLGKWLRVEGVVTNRAGGASPNGFTFKLYVKNITDGTPEIKMVDTTVGVSGNGIGSTGWLGADDLTPASLVSSFLVNNYREGQCSGYRAVSHYMVAGWDTDEGQRIGSAQEVEGVAGEAGSGVTPLPNPGAGWDPQPNVTRSQ